MTKPIPIDVPQTSSSFKSSVWPQSPRNLPRRGSFGYPELPNDLQLDPRQSSQYAQQLKAAFSHSPPNSANSGLTAMSPPLSPQMLAKSPFPATSAFLKRRSSVPEKESTTGQNQKPRSLSFDEASSFPISPSSSVASSFSEDLENVFAKDNRHHVRRPSVAIKFSPTYDLDSSNFTSSEKDAVMPKMPPSDDSNPLRRPPSPMAECILKGDFSFD